MKNPIRLGLRLWENLAYFRKLQNADILWWFGLNSGQFQNNINTQGYDLMRAQKYEKALAVFKLNTRLFRTSWNTWDSLAECYYKMKDYEQSLKCFERSVKMNPANENGKRYIELIKNEQKKM